MNVTTAKAADNPAKLDSIARLPDEWSELLVARGERSFRGRQIFKWLHEKGVFDPSVMTNLSEGLRAWLIDEGVGSPLDLADVKRSGDGTRKLLFGIRGGGYIESVLIPMTSRSGDVDADASASDDGNGDGDGDNEGENEGETTASDQKLTRVTLCISTQHGCAMGCRFCASGQAGLQRGLNAGEVVAQVLHAREHLDAGETLRNIVFMGMGEPLQHYEETARSLRLLSHPDGLNIGFRRVTVSTVGLVPGIRKLGEDFDGKVGLAISLHAPDDETRSKIIPMNERYPVGELIAALHDYPLPQRRRITIEYTLIAGINDSPYHARELAELLQGLPVKINLIPMNPISGSPWRAPEAGLVEDFRGLLADAGYSCFLRTRRGDEVDAACGQLALHGDPLRVRRSKIQKES